MTDIDMADGATLPIDGTAKTIDGAQLVDTDVAASNGLMQVTNALLGV